MVTLVGEDQEVETIQQISQIWSIVQNVIQSEKEANSDVCS